MAAQEPTHRKMIYCEYCGRYHRLRHIIDEHALKQERYLAEEKRRASMTRLDLWREREATREARNRGRDLWLKTLCKKYGLKLREESVCIAGSSVVIQCPACETWVPWWEALWEIHSESHFGRLGNYRKSFIGCGRCIKKEIARKKYRDSIGKRDNPFPWVYELRVSKQEWIRAQERPARLDW